MSALLCVLLAVSLWMPTAAAEGTGAENETSSTIGQSETDWSLPIAQMNLNPQGEDGYYEKQADGSTKFVAFSSLPDTLEDLDATTCKLPDGVSADQSGEAAPQFEFNFDRVRVGNTKTDPYYWIVYLESYFPSSSSKATGTGVVFADGAILTAGHCLYSYDYQEWADYVTISFAKNGSVRPFPSRDTTVRRNMRVGSKWSEDLNFDYDWGILESDDPSKPFGMGYMGFSSTLPSTSQRLTITGYPDVVNGDGTNGGMFTAGGYIQTVYTNTFTHKIDATAGDSGAPVYYKNSKGNYITVGVHSAEDYGRHSNDAVRISPTTETLMKKIRSEWS